LSAEDLLLAQKLGQDYTNYDVFQNGDSCDDGNPATSNDIYSNGICVGIMVYTSLFFR